MKKIINAIILVVLVVGLFSCNKAALNPTLAQQKPLKVSTLNDLQGLLNGALNRMTSSTYYGRDYIIFNEVRSDQCYANASSGRFLTPAAMAMGNDDAYAHDTWLQMYRVIANANLIIEQDPSQISGDAATIKQIMGQAYAIRALVHFDLLKLYGEENVTGGNNMGVPYVTTYKGSDVTPARSTVQQDLDSIHADLNMALSMMTASGNSTREYMSTWGVWALKSRVDLYFGEYDSCKVACERVINSGEYSIISAQNYASTFTNIHSPNIIFELAERPTDNQYIDGLSYIYRGSDYGDIAVRDNFLNIFDATDVRAAANMIGYDSDGYLRNIGKYPTNSDFNYDIPLIRYEEVILNYSEALFNLHDDADALTELNKITSNRGANAYTTISEANILQERQRELCFEGFAFDDIARTHGSVGVANTSGAVTTTYDWGSYNFAFPIPIAEIHANSNMVQNKGY